MRQTRGNMTQENKTQSTKTVQEADPWVNSTEVHGKTVQGADHVKSGNSAGDKKVQKTDAVVDSTGDIPPVLEADHGANSGNVDKADPEADRTESSGGVETVQGGDHVGGGSSDGSFLEADHGATGGDGAVLEADHT